MLAGEKILVKGKSKPFVACDRNHYDNIPIRVSDLDVNLDKPVRPARSPILRTGDL